MTELRRLDGPEVEALLARIDELLGRVEGVAGPTSQAAIAAVQALTQVYGEALARVLDLGGPRLAAALAGDELLSHLLVLHEIHPEPLERRVASALEAIRPAVRDRGGDVELAGISDGVATIRLTLKGCASTAAQVEQAVREAVLAAGPELVDVRRESASERAFVPLDALTRHPAVSTSGGPV